MQKSNKPFYGKFIKKNTITRHKKNIDADLSNKKIKFQQKKDTVSKANKILSSEIITTQNNTGNIFNHLDKDALKVLNSFNKIVKKALELNFKQETEMPKEIQKLFHELTDERGSRKINYLNNPAKLSAYVYYYSWWNLIRVCKLISKIDLNLNDENVIADFGCGPLTMTCAFWIARPELRENNLHWYCVDISGKALLIGEKIFYELCEFTGVPKESVKWQVTKITGKFGTKLNTNIDLFISANLFNEIFWDSSLKIPMEAERAGNTITKYLAKNGSALVIEPGIPLAGEFIYYLRKTILQKNFLIASPCPHNGLCSMPATNNKIFSTKNFIVAKNKWCHFSFFVDDAPKNLLRLSETVNLKKNRASLSFLYFKQPTSFSQNETQKFNSKYFQNNLDNTTDEEILNARISSDIIKLPNDKIGRYACSNKGFIFITEKKHSNSILKNYIIGSLVQIKTKKINFFLKDKKTGALLFEI